MTKPKAIWISYDFGLKADYSGLYTWLDNHNAVECGSGLAFLLYSTSLESSDEICADILKSIKKSVELNKSDIIYVIVRDPNTNLVKGKFINGGRKQAPWVGYGEIDSNENSDSEA